MRHRRRLALLASLPLLPLATLSLGVLNGAGPDDGLAWAQASSCGNAILEPGEECDPPGSISCPPGSPAGAILPCSADCTCPAVTAPLDHFQCYALKRQNVPTRSVTVQDQFGTMTEEIRFATDLCNPADKNGEGIGDPTDHLVGYDTRSPRFEQRTGQVVVNQFGTIRLDVTKPNGLLVPSSKDGVTQVPPLDHFQCYNVKRSKGEPKFTPRTVTVSDQLSGGIVQLQVRRPSRLCAPANKNGADPTAPSHPDHLLCYDTKGPSFGDAFNVIANQFGTLTVQSISRRELCVPSLKNPGSTTTTIATTTTTSSTSTIATTTTTSSTSTSTTSTTVETTSTTVATTSTTVETTSTTVATTSTTVETTSTTVETTSTTTSSTTSTTLYGSPSRAFLSPSESLLE